MRKLSLQEERATAEFKERVLKHFKDPSIRFRLFGSKARGEADEESDVDVLVLMKEAPSSVRGRVFEIASDIFLDYEVDVSPLVMSFSHFEDMKRRERLLPLEIERDGQTL